MWGRLAAVDAPVVDRSTGGVGVLDEGFRDYALGAMDAPAGSVFVIQFSGNCLFGPGGGCPQVPGSGPFFDAWKAALTTTVADARDLGLVPLLVAGPHVGPQTGAEADTALWIGIITLVVAQEHDVAVLDRGEALHDVDGQYQESLWYADLFQEPRWHQVRNPDGIHLAHPDGAPRRRLARVHGVAALSPVGRHTRHAGACLRRRQRRGLARPAPCRGGSVRCHRPPTVSSTRPTRCTTSSRELAPPNGTTRRRAPSGRCAT